eukprot:CAMPEP_0175993356 /NCGR_PEP_ID=MMETSP0108-20121206/53917_1 /TAXON_ID=195067 ORGANISM="Goniomonas pacifica, Strain CCMP1869" /NCGR_SAMPLE_ID=MMETSP0108 /ASSEMBLY_ACC=CAM_ASM_000204 /LENGTH=92 /DNA_ID=CAMNT_0017325131 /DNA_START=300 /DNA_END=578 /DNA_ORIENTATION=-
MRVQPKGQPAGVVLEQNRHHAFNGAEHSAMYQHRHVVLPVRSDVGQVEASGQLKVELDCSTLVLSPQSVADVNVNFRTIERSVGGIDVPGST